MKYFLIALASIAILSSSPVFAQTNQEETYGDMDSVRIDKERIAEDIRTGNRAKEEYDRQHLAADEQHLQEQLQTNRAEGIVFPGDRHFVHHHHSDYYNYGYGY